MKSYSYDRADSRVDQMVKNPGAYFKEVRARVASDTEAVVVETRTKKSRKLKKIRKPSA